jgi:Dyp-type peroxidase family
MTAAAPEPAPAMTGPSEAASPDFESLQGNILNGFNKDNLTLLVLALPDTTRARDWVKTVSDDLATDAEVGAFNRLFKEFNDRRNGERGLLKVTWVQLLLTAEGLRQLGVADGDVALLGDAFRDGMAAHATDLGDEEESDPSKWIGPWGKTEGGKPTVHAMLVVASDDAADMRRQADGLEEEAFAHGLRVLWREEGHTLPEPLTGHEHFGFKDGISQPSIDGITENPPAMPPSVPVSTFVLGSANAAGQALPEWAKDGSLVAFRRLRQDVAGFRDFLVQAGPGVNIDPALLGAKMVGRWQSGAPVARAPAQDDPTLGANPDQNNAFGYADDDPNGTKTPRFAHIRKVSPRDEAPVPGIEDAKRRRIIRRGIPYGDPLPPAFTPEEAAQDRGLLFFCCQSNLEEQFQFIQQSWANNPKFPVSSEPPVPNLYQPTPGQPDDGPDPVIGEHHGRGVDNLKRDGQADSPLTLSKQFVAVTGGEYFLAPSIKALAAWGSPPPAQPAT